MKPILTMQRFWSGLTMVMLLALSLTTGCGKKVSIDTSKLDYSFQTADQTTQSAVTEAVEAIDKADYPGATEKLKKVAANPKLTAEQKTAVDGVLQQLEKK